MSTPVKIGDLTSVPGRSVHGAYRVAERAASAIELPISIVQGERPGPTLVVVAGEHGCEYAGIVAAVRLARDLRAADLSGTVIIAPLANPVAFDSRFLFVNPIDQVNPYGAYPGDPGATVTFRIAHKILHEIALKGDAVVHLHGADYNEALVPFNYVPITGNEELDKRSSELASCFPVDYHLHALPASRSTSVPPVGTTYAVTADGTLYWEVAKRGIPATMVEAGKEGKLEDETVSIHYDGLLNVMRHMGILGGGAGPSRPFRVLKNPVLVANRSAGLFVPRVGHGETVRRGQTLGQVWDFRGEVLEEIASPIDGMVVCRINFVAVDSYPTQTQPYLFYITEVE